MLLYDVDIEASACVLSSRYAMLCYAKPVNSIFYGNMCMFIFTFYELIFISERLERHFFCCKCSACVLAAIYFMKLIRCNLLSRLVYATLTYLSWICCQEHIMSLEVKIIGRNFSLKEVQRHLNG